MSVNRNKQERMKLRKKWERHLKEWAITGLSQAEYCRNHKLAVNQFIYWKSKLSDILENNISLIQVPSPVITQVRETVSDISSDYEMRVTIHNDIQIEVKSDFKPQAFKRLISALMDIS